MNRPGECLADLARAIGSELRPAKALKDLVAFPASHHGRKQRQWVGSEAIPAGDGLQSWRGAPRSDIRTQRSRGKARIAVRLGGIKADRSARRAGPMPPETGDSGVSLPASPAARIRSR